MADGASCLYRDGWLTSQDGFKLYYRDYGDAMSPATPSFSIVIASEVLPTESTP